MTSTIAAAKAEGATSQPHPTLTIYNTLTKKKEPFATVRPGKVSIYLCGPTVYDKAHIGHMVGPVIFDCIKRYLVYCGFEVTWVVNITDVDDKLIKKANERGLTMLEIAEENIADYQENLAALNVDQIDHLPRATECMGEIVAFIQSLVDQGFAYEAAGDIYFDVGRDPGYGKLSNRTLESMQGEGGAGGQRKRHPADFALWKAAKPGEPSWPSPWAAGRPGWHIECSAMSRQLLGETFDIHGGGLDLVFPHHENEIAQSECCHQKPMVRYWAHNGLLRQGTASGKIGGRSERDRPAAAGSGDSVEQAVSGKMSRSKGAGGLADLIQRQGGERIRFFLLRTHYRSTVLFNEPAIEEAGTGLETFYRLFKRYQRITGGDFYQLDAAQARAEVALDDAADPALQAAATRRQKFLAAMDDDFNTGGAIAELFELAKLANKYCDEANLETGSPAEDQIATLTSLLTTLKELAGVLGLFGQPPASGGEDDNRLARVMPLLIELRAVARSKKDFATADTIRDQLAAAGVVLEDRPGGSEWSGGGSNTVDAIMQLLISLRAHARSSKDFATADTIRDRLSAAGITLEDRPGGTEWTAG